MKRDLIIIVIILAISGFFFRSYLFKNKLLFSSNLLVGLFSPWNTEQYPGWVNIPFKGLGADNLFIFYPMKTLIRKAVNEQSLPLWTPYNFTGGPLWGDGQSAPMYPLTYLYLLPSLPDAFSIMVILVPTLTMLFTYGLLRHFKLGRTAALFGAITFAFCGFMSVWMEENPAVSQSAIWLPLLIWLEDLLLTTPRRRWFLLFAVSVAVMMSSGFLQICLYELILIGAYALWKQGRAFLLVAFRSHRHPLVSPYLFVTWEAYKLSPGISYRYPKSGQYFWCNGHIFYRFLIPTGWEIRVHIISVGAGSYYDKALFIGVIPLVFVLIGLFTKKSKLEKFFWWTVAATLVMGFSSPFTQWLFGLPIPCSHHHASEQNFLPYLVCVVYHRSGLFLKGFRN